MQKLQQLQPQLKAIQARYKDDKQRQQQEMMKFYRENQVNPLASCLPLAAQLPVFISLFYMLRSSLRADICPSKQPGAHLLNGHFVGISHAHTVPCGPHGGASFLFIHDLTNKATGAVLVVLIVLYVGTQLISSRMMANPQMDQTQQRLIMLMPLFFVVFIINFPAGVILYWVTTNTWTMGQQYVIRRRLGMNEPAPATANGAAARSAGSTERRTAAMGPRVEAAASGGLAGLLRGLRSDGGGEGAATSTATRAARTTAPPPPPSKKKKRSGRRR